MIQDPNLNLKVRKTVEKISENMHIVGNEPSLALYRIQEHVRKVLPLVVDRRAEVEYLQQDLQGKVTFKRSTVSLQPQYSFYNFSFIVLRFRVRSWSSEINTSSRGTNQ